MECKSFIYYRKITLKNITFTFTFAQINDNEFNEKFRSNFNKY